MCALQIFVGVSLDVYKGETLGIVGESGCGKSTLGKTMMMLERATGGSVLFNYGGEFKDITKFNNQEMFDFRRKVQMVFQDPYSALNPQKKIYTSFEEPLKVHGMKSEEEQEERMRQVLKMVNIQPDYLMRYPHAFSGGQRQRIGIARALVIEPQIIVCDEAVSALDVSIQAQVINLLRDLQKELKLTYLFISHDLSVVEHISDKVGVMYLGRMVEFAPAEDLFEKPMHPYTEALLSAVPVADPAIRMERIPLKGEIPNPANPPSGCYFHERCHYCTDKCRTEAPALAEMPDGRLCACHRAKELALRGFTYEEGAKVQG